MNQLYHVTFVSLRSNSRQNQAGRSPRRQKRAARDDVYWHVIANPAGVKQSPAAGLEIAHLHCTKRSAVQVSGWRPRNPANTGRGDRRAAKNGRLAMTYTGMSLRTPQG
ncbi:MAG: hypothetical protein AB1453_11440 [Chloroflexota bacterium]